MAKVQSQLLVSETTRDRADALALARGEKRAEVYRLALEPGLKVMEEANQEGLKRVADVAAGMGMTPLELARRAAADGYALADLEGRKRYPRSPKA